MVSERKEHLTNAESCPVCFDDLQYDEIDDTFYCDYCDYIEGDLSEHRSEVSQEAGRD